MSPLETIVRGIHASSLRLVLAATGGGASAAGLLLRFPGGSRTVLDASVPYAAQALAEYLGAAPEQYCSSRTARSMAMAAWMRGRRLTQATSDDIEPLVGVGCTASLVSEPPKRGSHRIHIGIQTAALTRTVSLTLEKGLRTRPAEEDLAASLIVNEIARSAGVSPQLPLDLHISERLEVQEIAAPNPWRQLLVGDRSTVCIPSGGNLDGSETESPPILFPGAFNPLHEGHQKIAALAAAELRNAVHFELSVFNVDKPPLDYIEMTQRVAQFATLAPVWLTRAPTFLEKARLFPGVTFLVGADTLVRIGETRYYQGDEQRRDAALAELAALGARFLVFSRRRGDTIQSLENLEVPATLRDLCRGIPPAAFCLDISSTELRRQSQD